MKTNKVTIPESGVDVNLLEREFFEKMREKGIISTRMLDLDMDYSRDFIIIDSEIGEFINTGIEMFYEESFKKTFPYLSSLFHKKYNYLYVNQDVELNNKLNLNASLRYDRFRFQYKDKLAGATDFSKQTRGIVSPKFNISFAPNQKIKLYLITGLVFIPTTQE